MRRLAFVCALCALPLLAACSGPGASARDAELDELRARVERMEREAAGERARLEGELDALRRSMDEAGRRAADPQSDAVQPGADRGSGADGRKGGGASPRAALKQSFNEALEASRQAIARLNRSLEESLWRGGARPGAGQPGPSAPTSPGPSDSSGPSPSGPAAPGAAQPKGPQ